MKNCHRTKNFDWKKISFIIQTNPNSEIHQWCNWSYPESNNLSTEFKFQPKIPTNSTRKLVNFFSNRQPLAILSLNNSKPEPEVPISRPDAKRASYRASFVFNSLLLAWSGLIIESPNNILFDVNVDQLRKLFVTQRFVSFVKKGRERSWCTFVGSISIIFSISPAEQRGADKKLLQGINVTISHKTFFWFCLFSFFSRAVSGN